MRANARVPWMDGVAVLHCDPHVSDRPWPYAPRVILKRLLAELAERRGWVLKTGVEAEYSLLHRATEHELIPAAEHHGVGLLAWAPLGRGVLTGKYIDGTPADSRGASPALAPTTTSRKIGYSRSSGWPSALRTSR